jgi:lipoprotein-anchoring transpeptidase ErfK/SrfK
MLNRCSQLAPGPKAFSHVPVPPVRRRIGFRVWLGAATVALMSATTSFSTKVKAETGITKTGTSKTGTSKTGTSNRALRADTTRGMSQHLAPVRSEPARIDPSPLLAVVSLADQRITVHNAKGQVADGRISSGQEGHRTPTGLFSIIQKNKYHESNIYSGAPMPYMQRLTWSGIALHEGQLPGYPASHGCIRLSGGFAQQLWGMTKLGARVVVTPRHAAPFAIRHSGLPKPVLTPASSAPVATASAAAASISLISTAQASTGIGDTGTLLTPLEIARDLKRLAAASVTDSTRMAAAALSLASTQATIANDASARKLAATELIARSNKQIEAAERAFDTARTPDQADAANAAGLAAVARLEDAERDLEIAARDENAVAPLALDAALAARVAETAKDAAEAALKDANRRLEPINIFISRKERTVYVRQGFTPIFEATITIDNADEAIGTHLYLASAVSETAQDLQWMAITVPETTAAGALEGQLRENQLRESQLRESQLRESRARGRSLAEIRELATRANAAPRLRETASGALDRIALPDDALRFIAERLWVGASLTISDYGISNETGKGTDFVVLTK